MAFASEGQGENGVATKGDKHPDPFVEAVRWQIHEGELMQALGRARGINRTDETPLDIDLAVRHLPSGFRQRGGAVGAAFVADRDGGARRHAHEPDRYGAAVAGAVEQRVKRRNRRWNTATCLCCRALCR